MPKRKLSIGGAPVLQTSKRSRRKEAPSASAGTEQEDAEQLWASFHKYKDYRLPTFAASEDDLLGLSDLNVIVSTMTPPSVSLFAITKIRLDSLHIHFSCHPPGPDELFKYIWHALISNIKACKYTRPLQTFTFSWGSRTFKRNIALGGNKFELADAAKANLMKTKGYGAARWPTFTSAVNTVETVGWFQLDIDVRNASRWGTWLI